MAEQVRIFVSHHHSPSEDAFTERLVADLVAAGADVWVDSERIPSGNFLRKINEGLIGRQWLVLVMTPDALKSPWVQEEVYAALHQVNSSRMLGIIPIIAIPCDERDIPPLWAPLHRYDATRDYPSALSSLRRAMNLTQPAHQATSFQPISPSQPPTPVATHQSPSSPPAASTQHAAWLPPHLAEFGFIPRTFGKVEVILPPLAIVPEGEFLMGSDKERDALAWDDELPLHSVTVPAYQIATLPVTVAEYACFVRANGNEPQTYRYRNGKTTMNWTAQLAHLGNPVVCVTWHNATKYAAWLAKLTGQPWRLPTEAEWEKAARGTDGRIYPWGDYWDKSRCNSSESYIGAINHVGVSPTGASPCGVLDMAGNVWEWTSTLLKSYPYSQSDGREDLDSTGPRVRRGGAWNSGPRSCRAAIRYSDVPDDFNGDSGFRLVLAAPGT